MAAVGTLFDTHIVAGGQQIIAGAQHVIQQQTEFDIAIAAQAGIRRQAPGITRHKVIDHTLPKLGPQVEHLMIDSQVGAGHSRSGHGVGGRVVPQAQSNAAHRIALLSQQQGRRRAIESATHGHGHTQRRHETSSVSPRGRRVAPFLGGHPDPGATASAGLSSGWRLQ